MSESGMNADPCAKLSMSTPDCDTYPPAGEPREDPLAGQWEVRKVLQVSPGGRMSNLGPSIHIDLMPNVGELNPIYKFTFYLQGQLFPESINILSSDAAYLELDSDEEYSVYAYRVADAEMIVVTIKYLPCKSEFGADFKEDNDTVTFTATKIEYMETPA